MAPGPDPVARASGGRPPVRWVDTPTGTLVVGLVTALAAGVIVSGTALWLRPIQAANQDIDTVRDVLEVAGIPWEGDPRRAFARQVRVRMVDLATGEYTAGVDPVGYDPVAYARDPETSREIPKDEDIAGVGRVGNVARVYLIQEEGELRGVVLPVRGQAWSEISALLAVAEDGNTILGFKAYRHEETPGLGGRVDDSDWRALWAGKLLRDAGGTLRFRVGPTGEGADAAFRVDALTGATFTSEGVQNIVRFW
ncbi:MAG TPA: NADH:ubiquinone reductase (Na(+)-transporting) subunit C, partial [Longimicrobiales bacterium]|nr:NADH:ubiquinone reductase (Na(+)-transporting) subunit C [Longimicrobiales bacterium]